MSIYQTWNKEKKERFENLAVIIFEDLGKIIKNSMISPKSEKVIKPKITKEMIEKYGFTIDEVCEVLDDFVYFY